MRKVIALEAKLAAVFASGWPGLKVSELCARLGISRQTFYKYRHRFETEGPAGLVERSRRPHRSPGGIPAELENEIIRLRKTLPVDNGAQTIAYHLTRTGWPAPSVSTIHRVLRRREMIIPQPEKRPRSAIRRFEWAQPNQAWQIDATRWMLADGHEAWIMDLIDDHSRLAVAAQACQGPTTEQAWAAFSVGAATYGLPAQIMSDNGPCFTGRFSSGGANRFETNLANLGIGHLLSSPGHPQTCGKLERFHQTTKRWLATQPPAATLTQLQTQLDHWLDYYNQQRPHRALTGATPTERWQANPKAHPGPPLLPPPRTGYLKVTQAGAIDWDHYQIGIGIPHAGTRVLVIGSGLDLTIYGPQGQLRQLTIDPTRRYQPTGKPPGRPPKTNPLMSAMS